MIGRMLLFNLIYILLFNGLADYYFYRFALCKITTNRWIKRAHWILNILFVAAIWLIFWLDSQDREVSHQVLQIFMFVYLIIYLPKLCFMVFSSPALLWRNKTFKRVFYTLGGTIGGVIFLSMLYGNLIGRNTLRVTEVEISSPKLPEAFDGYKIVQLADMHVGNMCGDRVIRKALDKVEEIDPDMIVFCGDMVHSRTNEVFKFRDVLSRFSAKDGVFTILGNHDYGDYTRWPNEAAHQANLQDLVRFYEDIDWTLLNNASSIIRRGGDSIALIGVENWGEPPFPQHGDLKKATTGTDSIDYKVLLSHNPNHWISEVKGKTDIDLTLSGHTHAMQLAVKLGNKRYSPSSLRYKLWGGLYSEGDQYIYVNEGMGVVLFPFRLGATPELTLITLKKE